MPHPAEILGRFPGPVTLNASRRKWFFVLAGGFAFVAGGVILIRNGDTWTGGSAVLFFALVAVVGAVMLLPGAGRLVLDAEGFEVSSLFKRRHWRWTDVNDFTTARIPPSLQAMVVYNDVAAQASRLAGINTAIAGRNNGLPDTYGWSTEALAELMTQWRARALAQPR